MTLVKRWEVQFVDGSILDVAAVNQKTARAYANYYGSLHLPTTKIVNIEEIEQETSRKSRRSRRSRSQKK